MKLTGDMNQCAACSLYFRSTTAFDKHRVGDFSAGEKPNRYGPVRRCMNENEMRERGMAINARGMWVTALNPLYAEAAIAAKEVQ